MSDEIDKETITRKVTSNTISNTNTPVEQYRVSEQITTKVDDNNNAIGLILIILVPLALGAGIAAYFYYLTQVATYCNKKKMLLQRTITE